MKCGNPTIAFIIGSATAKDGIVSPRLTFSSKEALRFYNGNPDKLSEHALSLPCGKCPACQVKKRKDMATRLVHEFSMHGVGCFVTLTYDDVHLPLSHQVEDQTYEDFLRQVTFGTMSISYEVLDNPTLYPPHLQSFIKRLRRNIEYHEGLQGVRFYAVGEYGGRTHRPHYHMMIFGWTPKSRDVFFKRKGHFVYKSDLLARLWSHGYVSFCDLSAAVAKYAARYTTKKLVEERRDINAPWRIGVQKEFFRQSVKGGGIGSPWLVKYRRNLLQGLLTYRVGDRVTKVAIPDYYIRRLRKIDPDLFLQVREQRVNYAKSHSDDLPFDRQYADWVRFVDWYDNFIDKELSDDSM